MSGLRSGISAEDLLSRPDDGLRHELIEGEICDMPPAGARHGGVASHIGALLQRHITDTGAGRGFAAETGFVLSRDPDTVRAPDFAFVASAGAQQIGDVIGYWPSAPDLAVEVVSPGDSYSEVHEKALAWLSAGTQLVLVVDPATRTATAYRPPGDATLVQGGDTVDLAPLLPGLTLTARMLFP